MNLFISSRYELWPSEESREDSAETSIELDSSAKAKTPAVKKIAKNTYKLKILLC